MKNAFAILLIFLPILFIFVSKAYPTRSVETVELDSTVDTNLGENARKVDAAILSCATTYTITKATDLNDGVCDADGSFMV